MFYAEEKIYPYGFITGADKNNITISEEMNDKVITFKTRTQAAKFFKSLGWFYSVNIIDMREAIAQ